MSETFGQHFRRAARRDWKFLARTAAMILLGVSLILAGRFL